MVERDAVTGQLARPPSAPWLRRLVLLGASAAGLWLAACLGNSSAAHADTVRPAPPNPANQRLDRAVALVDGPVRSATTAPAGNVAMIKNLLVGQAHSVPVAVPVALPVAGRLAVALRPPVGLVDRAAAQALVGRRDSSDLPVSWQPAAANSPEQVGSAQHRRQLLSNGPAERANQLIGCWWGGNGSGGCEAASAGLLVIQAADARPAGHWPPSAGSIQRSRSPHELSYSPAVSPD